MMLLAFCFTNFSFRKHSSLGKQHRRRGMSLSIKLSDKLFSARKTHILVARTTTLLSWGLEQASAICFLWASIKVVKWALLSCFDIALCLFSSDKPVPPLKYSLHDVQYATGSLLIPAIHFSNHRGHSGSINHWSRNLCLYMAHFC